MSFRSALDRWAARQDAAMLDALGKSGSWLSGAAVVLLIVAIGAWIPATARHLQLDARAALIAFVLPAVGGFGLALSHEADRPYSRAERFSTLWTSATLQLFCAVLVARSSMAGSLLFLPLLLFTAATHGFMMRATVAEPFPALGTLLAAAIGVSLCRSYEQALLLTFSGLVATAASLYLGTFSTRADENRERRERMQAAIAAQQLHDQTTRIRELSDSLVDALGYTHDAGNALSMIQLSTDLVSTLKDSLPEHRLGDVERIERTLRNGSRRIAQLLEESRKRRATLDADAPTQLEPVALAEAVREVVETTGARFSEILIETHVPPKARVEVAGGMQSLLRILENLVLNALQGNGARGAHHVALRVDSEHAGAVHRIVVEDDGPGFDAEQLSQPVSAFSTSKRSGTGLGLYTVERLVTASGGTLRRVNRPEGGALVAVTLPRSGR